MFMVGIATFRSINTNERLTSSANSKSPSNFLFLFASQESSMAPTTIKKSGIFILGDAPAKKVTINKPFVHTVSTIHTGEWPPKNTTTTPSAVSAALLGYLISLCSYEHLFSERRRLRGATQEKLSCAGWTAGGGSLNIKSMPLPRNRSMFTVPFCCMWLTRCLFFQLPQIVDFTLLQEEQYLHFMHFNTRCIM